MTMTASITNRAGIVKLWLLNFVANAVVIAAAYFWLLIPDARGWQIAGSGLIAVLAVALVLWLRAGTLAYFRITEFRRGGTVWRAYRHALGHVAALAIWVLVFLVFAWLLWNLDPYVPQFAVWFRQKLGGGPSLSPSYDWRQRVAIAFDLRLDAGIVAAHSHDCFGRGFQARTHRPLAPSLEAAPVLALVLPAAWHWDLCAIQTGLVDPRLSNHSPAGLEHGLAFLVGIRDRRHGVFCSGLDDRYLHRPRRSNRGSHRIIAIALLHRYTFLKPPDNRRAPILANEACHPHLRLRVCSPQFLLAGWGTQ